MVNSCDPLAIDDEFSSLQGIVIVQDTERGVFVNVVKTSSTDSTFKTVHAKLETAAKKSDNGNLFAQGYPFNQLPAGMQGVVKGVFSDLQLFVGVAIDPNDDTDA